MKQFSARRNPSNRLISGVRWQRPLCSDHVVNRLAREPQRESGQSSTSAPQAIDPADATRAGSALLTQLCEIYRWLANNILAAVLELLWSLPIGVLRRPVVLAVAGQCEKMPG